MGIIPNYAYDSVFMITPGFLKENNIGALALDIDNTLSPYSDSVPSKETVGFIQKLKASGIYLFIVSNNKDARISAFAKTLDLPCIYGAKKPLSHPTEKFILQNGIDKDTLCVIGDQFFTDMWLSANLNVRSILISPIDTSQENAFIRFKRILEKPLWHFSRKSLIKKGRWNIATVSR
ncbi:MAG: YqeG family HAD IIIA-type phosphatase [Clostridia bacterium]|nr:YqeG family HAD IIIA-type phosphatase [Clostridia bacterium]